jgi:hypothetical protein
MNKTPVAMVSSTPSLEASMPAALPTSPVATPAIPCAAWSCSYAVQALYAAVLTMWRAELDDSATALAGSRDMSFIKRTEPVISARTQPSSRSPLDGSDAMRIGFRGDADSVGELQACIAAMQINMARKHASYAAMSTNNAAMLINFASFPASYARM